MRVALARNNRLLSMLKIYIDDSQMGHPPAPAHMDHTSDDNPPY
jgi:hypothetical protein